MIKQRGADAAVRARGCGLRKSRSPFNAPLYLAGGAVFGVHYSWLEQPREELLKLLAMNEVSGFISCMIEHFEWMAEFTLVVDEIVKTGK